MTVLKSKRGISNMEFYHNALNLRKYVTYKLLKDFGIKNKLRDKIYFIDSGKLSDANREKLAELLKMCDYSAQLEEYPQWFIRREREYISDLCRHMIADITAANNIYITNQQEADERRSLQNSAIASVECLMQEITFVMDMIPEANADKLQSFVEMSQREISLLKGWRKSDNKLRLSLKTA